MSTPRSTLEARGITVEADGTILLDRSRLAPPPGGVEGQRVDHLSYTVANPFLSAIFENSGRIASYQAFNAGPLLEPGAWRQTLMVDGQDLSGYPARTRAGGRLFEELWTGSGWQLTVSSYCDGERNALFQACYLVSLDGRPHTLEVGVRAGFLIDEEQAVSGLRYDERLQAIVAVLGEARGEEEPQVSPAPARVVLVGADLPPARWRVSGPRAFLSYRLETPPGQERGCCLVVSGGWTITEHETLLQQARAIWPQALQEARRYGQWLSDRLAVQDNVLHGLFVACLHTGLSAYRQDHWGRFQGLVPRPDFGVEVSLTFPPDTYWAAQAILPYQPEMVRDHIRSLARAVHEDGRLARSVRTTPRPGEAGPSAYDEWPDACDSPSYFALLVHDYLCWTGEHALLDEQVAGRTIWESVRACVEGLRRRDTNHDYLIEKRRLQPDWAFDVLRDDWVTSDLVLHLQALKNAAELALLRGEQETAADYATWAVGAQRAINHRMWNEERGFWVDYIRSYQGFVEDHAALDTVVAALYSLGTDSQCHRHLEHLEQKLETRHNLEQYYGDWGVMGCFPFYKQREDLTGCSVNAYGPHNGAAWPGWCGVLALAALLHRRPGWRYALERWWTYGLEQYWTTPVEYYAPPYDAPGVRQSAHLSAWSAMPAAAIVLGGFGFWPNLAGEVVLRVPPWGDSRLHGVRFRGETYDIIARNGVVTLLQEGEVVAASEHGLRVRLGHPVVEG